MNRQVAKVAVSVAAYHIDRMYDYLIPDELQERALPGMRVQVPFGKGSKRTEGLILSVSPDSKFDSLKSICSLMDDELIAGSDDLRLALWMRERFFCTVYDALRCMLPSKTHFKRKTKSRAPLTAGTENTAPLTLSSEQKAVYESILPLIESDKPEAALLYGVTGSGKTIVYINLIKETLRLGKTAIMLVPEIGLTPQAVRLFETHFGDFVAVLHSALGEGERYNEWKRIREGCAGVVIGTRSAVFAPLKNIGLIVIDEEQEHTYKSDKSPRYHAREIAKYKITQSSGLLLLASATPSVDSMYAAKTGKYKLFRIDNRYNDSELPPVLIADMKAELKAGNGGQISSLLRDAIAENIKKGEQSILFINRRGASPVVACPGCGYTYKCKNCSVSITYHMSVKRLLCHHCGYSIPVPDACPECEGKLKFIGAGTQKVEHELYTLFPGISIIRMDADTTSRKDSHNKLLDEFREKKAAILLGTQMVTKGLDFENVTLVGVISADRSLYMSDFRANETTFSMITQVVGRSGRGLLPGRAVIQTYTPENKVILLASKQDFDAFYESEIALRQALSCPPVRDLLSLTVAGIDENAVVLACDMLKFMLHRYFEPKYDIDILGPAPAPVSKVNNKYMYTIMVNCVSSKQIRETLSHIIREFMKNKKSRGVSVYADTV